jgi:hypothetical protein
MGRGIQPAASHVRQVRRDLPHIAAACLAVRSSGLLPSPTSASPTMQGQICRLLVDARAEPWFSLTLTLKTTRSRREDRCVAFRGPQPQNHTDGEESDWVAVDRRSRHRSRPTGWRSGMALDFLQRNDELVAHAGLDD